MTTDWQTVKLSDVAYEVSDRVDNPSTSGYDRFVGLEHFISGDFRISKWGTTENLISAMKLFKAGDTLFARRNAYLKRVSMADFDGICSGDAIVLRNNEKMIDGFLPLILNTDHFWDYAIANAAGSMSKRVRVEDLMKYEFPLPPVDEQRRIADLLWAADDMVNATSELIDSISKVKAAVRKENFTQENGSKVLLKDLCDPKGIQIGPFGSQLHASDYVQDGIPVVMPANMTDDKIDETDISRITPKMADSLSQHKVLPGDILLPRRGELDRRAFIRQEEKGWLCGTGSLRIRVKKGINPRAVFHALASVDTVSWIKNHAVGTTMPNINATIVSNIPISLPDKADEIVEMLEKLDESLETATNKRTADIGLKKELLKKYLG